MEEQQGGNGRVPAILVRLSQIEETARIARQDAKEDRRLAREERAEMLNLLKNNQTRLSVVETQHRDCQNHVADGLAALWASIDERKEVEGALRSRITGLDRARKWEGRVEALIATSLAVGSLFKP